MRNPNRLTLALLLALAQVPALAAAPSSVPVDATMRRAVVAELSRQLKSNYVFPDVAEKAAAALAARQAAGAYDRATDAQAFSSALAADLKAAGNDLHFHVAYDPDVRARPAGTPPPPSAEDVQQMRRQVMSRGFGIDSVRRLPGNVGYMEVRGFGPAEMVGEAMTSAVRLLSGTEALILDLRRNGGGEPDSVAYLLSHFFAEGDSRHLNDIYSRGTDTTRQYWTNPAVTVRYTRPIYVLTSRRTFSGGEEAAYDLQTQKRATLVGEVTGGGANPGEGYPIGHGFAAFIPNGRAINPITRTNWEHTGVAPDVAVPAADALKTAHAAALKTQLAAATGAEEKTALRDLIAQVESGVAEVPVYTPPRR